MFARVLFRKLVDERPISYGLNFHVFGDTYYLLCISREANGWYGAKRRVHTRFDFLFQAFAEKAIFHLLSLLVEKESINDLLW